MSSSATGPIDIGQGRTATPGTPVVSGSTLYYICTSSDSDLKLVTCDVSSVQSSGSVSSLTGNVWSNTTVSTVSFGLSTRSCSPQWPALLFLGRHERLKRLCELSKSRHRFLRRKRIQTEMVQALIADNIARNGPTRM